MPHPHAALGIRAIIAALTALTLAAPGSAAIIYQCRAPGTTVSSIYVISDPDEPSSFSELPTPTTREFESRVGDVITFAGTDRLVTSFSTRLAAFGGNNRGLTVDAELSIYENASGLPGALLWSGNANGLNIPQFPSSGMVEATFTPNLVLPDTVCFAIAFTNIVIVPGESRTLGIATTSNTTVGSSPVTTIHQLSADNSWFIEDISTFAGGAFRHVEARVEAIPSPAATFLLLGVLVPALRRAP